MLSNILVSMLFAGGLEVTYLANEAYLVDDGERAVLFDAFVPEPYSVYEPLGEESWQAMLDGEPPFDRVVAAVVSHRHGDHFQAKAAVAFLAAHPEVTLFGPPDVIDEVRAAGYAGERLVSVWPEHGQSSAHEVKGIRLELFRLWHRQGGVNDIQNLGALVDMGGKRVLHVGDAYTEADNFAPYDLEARNIDIAFIPDWYFATEWFAGGPALVSELIDADCVAATHVALKDRDETLARLKKEFPQVLLPPPPRGGMLDLAQCPK